MGNSIASAMRMKDAVNEIYGVESNAQFRNQAFETGSYAACVASLDELSDSINHASAPFDIVLVCTPVDTVPMVVADCVQKFPGAIVSDIGSTKSEIVAKTDRLLASLDHRFVGEHRFVGGHPIAGGDATGPITPPNSIFTNKLFVATPSAATNLQSIERIEKLWQALDCKTIRLDPAEHDRLLGLTSHMPHVVSAVLSATLEEDEAAFCGTGWRDTTRIAKSNPLLWKEILVHNRDSVQQAMDRFLATFEQIKNAIETEDWDSVVTLMEKGKQNRDALGN